MKLLIADDDETARIALQDILRQMGEVTILQAGNGQEALDLLTAGLRPDLCIFDLRMPGLDGLNLVQAIRRDPLLCGLRIAIASGSRDREAIIALAALGVSGYLLKPYSPERVLVLARAAAEESRKALEAKRKRVSDAPSA